MLVPYQIDDPQGMFSPTYVTAIRAGAEAWSRASAGFVRFQECTVPCTGQFISVVPGDGDGITNPESTREQLLPMPVVGSDDRISPHRIAHQWGHALGLAHTYERADRDRYMRFDPAMLVSHPAVPGCRPAARLARRGPTGCPPSRPARSACSTRHRR